MLGFWTRWGHSGLICELGDSVFYGALMPLHLCSQIQLYPQLSHHPPTRAHYAFMLPSGWSQTPTMVTSASVTPAASYLGGGSAK